MTRLLIVVALLALPVHALTQARQARTAAQCTGAPCTIVSSVIAPKVSFEQAFTLDRVITLEATAEAPILNPILTVDPAGGFLMAEGRALGSFRRYGADGKLLWYVPAEKLHRDLRNPQIAVRLSPTVVLLGGRPATGLSMVVQFDEPKKEMSGFWAAAAIRGSMTSLGLLSDASLLVTAGIKTAADRALIAIDLAGARPVRSFFSPHVSALTREAVALGSNNVQSASRGDTIAAVFAYSDTIYVMNKESVILERIRLPTLDFVLPTRPSVADPASIGAWRSSVGEAVGIYWLKDGRFVIEYQRAVGPNLRRERCFLVVARNGDGVLDVRGWDSHIQTTDSQGTFYFVDPQTDDRSRLLVATLKSGR